MPLWEISRKQPAPPKAHYQIRAQAHYRVWKGAYLGEKMDPVIESRATLDPPLISLLG